MNHASKFLAGAVIGLGTLAATAGTASAAVVCNADGYCWHVHRHYTYAPEYGVVVHPDNWRWRHGEHYVWREHRGRGYWRNGVWVTF